MGLLFLPAAAQVAGQGLSVDALIAAVIERNPSVLAAVADASGAREDLESARWQRFPSVSMQTETGSRSQPVGTVSVTQPLWFISGAIPAQIEGADATASAKRIRIAEVRYQAAERTVDLWRAVSVASGRREVIGRSLQRLENFQALMRRRVDASVSPPVELDLVSSRLQQSKVELAEVEAARRVSISQLEQLLGKPVTTEFSAAEETLQSRAQSAMESVSDVSESDIANWAAEHPSVRRAQQDFRTVTAQVEAKRAERWPQVYAKVQYVRSSPGVPGGTGVSVGVQYAPGAGLSSLSQERSAQARADSAAQAVELARRDVVGAFKTDASDLQSARERRARLEAGIGDARKVLESYERLFVAGRRSWLDVLTAVRDLQQSEVALVDAQVALIAGAQRIQIRSGQKSWQKESAS
jgi:adhesin transport system outer membrane protein